MYINKASKHLFIYKHMFTCFPEEVLVIKATTGTTCVNQSWPLTS